MKIFRAIKGGVLWGKAIHEIHNRSPDKALVFLKEYEKIIDHPDYKFYVYMSLCLFGSGEHGLCKKYIKISRNNIDKGKINNNDKEYLFGYMDSLERRNSIFLDEEVRDYPDRAFEKLYVSADLLKQFPYPEADGVPFVSQR